MRSLKILRAHKKEVVDSWVEAVFATYPLETTGFLRTASDPFTNPVAHMTREAAGVLFDAVAGEDVEAATVRASLDRFVKLRAVQKFAPSQSLAVFYLMKPILREKVMPEMRLKGRLEDYLDAESRLDTLALLAFDIYAEARETVAESRIKEIKNQHAQLARWAQRLENGPGMAEAAGPESQEKAPRDHAAPGQNPSQAR
ncbi:MAG: hypothetical protein HDQ90_00880 [Desulfovibrio sp.]|nr:hypothetical protein [Desulfovibrio sp.]